MRTTLNLDDDVLQLTKTYAKSRSIALGEAVSELVRKGLCAPTPTRLVNGILVFDVPESTVTSKRVKDLESELE